MRWTCCGKKFSLDTMCPRSSDPYYIVTYYMKRVTTSWTYSTLSALSVNELQLKNYSQGYVSKEIYCP